MTTETTKEQALANFLSLGVRSGFGPCADDIPESTYDDSLFEAPGGEEYLVLTDDEADQRVTEYITESVWAFNASFLSEFTELPEEVFIALSDKCEDANDAILAIIERCKGGIETFSSMAVSADGRGHFMSSYDGEENESGDFYIYRTN